MTFIPSVLSVVDNNNSITTTASSFTGTSSRTAGYNQIQISAQLGISSVPLGFVVSFSSDGISFTPLYSDTIFANTNYFRVFPITNTYYKISLNLVGNGTINLETRLTTSEVSTTMASYYAQSQDSFHDAFSKLRVSNPYSILDLRFPSQTVASGTDLVIRDNHLLICSKSTGGYTATYQRSKAIIQGTGLGSYTSQSRQYAIYQPGKSQLFLGSGLIGDIGVGGTIATPDYIARIGLFDNSNGLFFSFDSAGGISVVLRKDGSDTQTYQSDWNIDPMDGTGKTGFNLDFTKTQLFVIDFEWLGVGRIRFGFYAFGQIFYCHQILNINQLTECYMINCNLPIRYQLIGQNAGSVSTAYLTQICSTVISEGGYNPAGRPFAVSRTTSTNIPANSEAPILALRYRNNANHENIVPTSSTVVCTTNDIFVFRVRIYPAPVSPGTIGTWTTVDNNSVIEYATSITSYTTTNSVVVDEGYVVGKNSSTYANLATIFKLIQITANVDNVSDILVLSIFNPNNNGLSVYGGMTWQEAY